MQNHSDTNFIQRGLFCEESPEGKRPAPGPMARRTDAASSHAAARQAVESGSFANQMAAVLEWLRDHSGAHTAKEISSASGIDYYTVSRRLKPLERAGLVERLPIRDCAVTGKPAIPRRAR